MSQRSPLSLGPVVRTDHLVIGSGIAGLTLALKLSKKAQVLVICKGALEESNTWYAQGGIASVLDAHDTFESHIEDTKVAGAGLCHDSIVDLVVRRGPRAVRELCDQGACFTGKSGSVEGDFHLTKEGGHSHRRVIHAEDLTGKEVMRALIAQVKTSQQIEVLEQQMAVDLITSDRYAPDFSGNRCLGAYILDKNSKAVYQVRAAKTYLCTGGHGRTYLYTSNPDAATGDGLAMGSRAGARIANLEFMQFHPTCLFHPQAKTFLISEAVRGEGGILRNRHGQPFMDAYHPQGSLAPRDIVARAIDSELKKTGDENVYLDVSALGEERLAAHFPNIVKVCRSFGINLMQEMIPVIPAAHYSCGGLVVDKRGRTNVGSLYALGEVACTGLHGANRLASNSLLEALVFADLVATDGLAASALTGSAIEVEIPPWDDRGAAPADEQVILSHSWDEIRRLMWHYVGIVRSDQRLQRALTRITAIREELDRFYWDYQLTDALLEVRNLALVADLTIRCARRRKESRGIHYTLDYPESSSVTAGRDTILS